MSVPNALTGLLPLEPPPPPPAPWWDGLEPVLAGVLVCLVVLWWWYRPASRHTRRLRALRRRLADPHGDTRLLADALHGLLLDALDLPRLAPDAAPGSLPPGQWRRLLADLDRARFQAEPPAAADLLALLADARRALRGGHA